MLLEEGLRALSVREFYHEVVEVFVFVGGDEVGHVGVLDLG